MEQITFSYLQYRFHLGIQNQNNKVSVYYYGVTRVGKILQTMLRTHCCSLNEHPFHRIYIRLAKLCMC